ncbi:hypothetical protein [Nocardia cerradoensis]|nr:hypothetical protein [Nocardia cerradoensis]
MIGSSQVARLDAQIIGRGIQAVSTAVFQATLSMMSAPRSVRASGR